MKKYLIVLSALVMIGNNCSFTMEFNPSAGQETPSGAKIQNETTQFGTKNNNDRKQFNENKDLKQTSILNGEEVCSPVSTAQELGPYPPVNQEDSKYNNMSYKGEKYKYEYHNMRNQRNKDKLERNSMCPNGQPCEDDLGKYYMGDNANNIDTNEINNNPFSRTNNNNIEKYYNKENRTDRKKYNQLRYSTIDGISPDYYNHYGIKRKNSLKESINMELEAGNYTDEKVLKPLNGDDITPL